MTDTEMKKRMSLYLTPSLKKQLEALAKAKSRTMSNMVEVLIIEAVEKAKANKEI
ncbi:MAG: ribbon-helix-helix protein, CopG family [Cyanobacteria bacterium P01_A01_bin.40]